MGKKIENNCNGILCKTYKKTKKRCGGCKKKVCGMCGIYCVFDKKMYCSDCYIDSFFPQWENIDKEIDKIMLKKTKKNINRYGYKTHY